MKKILLLTNSFPPINSPATNRYVSFAKYLTEFGHEVIVITPKWTENSRNYLEQKTGFITNSNFTADTFQNEYRVVKVEFNGRDSLGEAFFEKLIAKCTLNSGSYILGDLKKKMLNKVFSICEAENIDLIISGGLPEYLSEISSKASKKYDVPWIADYRDVIGQVSIQATNQMDYFRQFLTRALYIRRDNQYTKSAIVKTAAAQKIVDILCERGNSSVHLVMNGFNPNDFVFESIKQQGDKFTIIHGGTIYPFQAPEVFLEGLKLFLESSPELASKLSVKFFGQSSDFIKPMIKSFPFPEIFKFSGYVERKTLLEEIKSSDLILFLSVQEKGITTSKIYECLASQVRILSVPGDKDITSEMILKANAGGDASTPEAVKNELKTLFHEWECEGKLKSNVNLDYINQYSRKEQAKKLAEIIDAL
ncbi:hypothetical protein [Pseudoalteromonas phenolica]|uniref:hypothetical protein n=1 Tax=Pseudoalteromonas phenolica TaxID=161398 RepID=UPI00384B19D4